MRSHRLLMAVAALAVAGPMAAQDTPPPPPPPAPTELVFAREVFDYPVFDRRNPFARLSANAAGGPRFDQIGLRTIIFSSNPQQSIAIFSTGGGAALEPGADATMEIQLDDIVTRRLRPGQSWGNMRLISVQRDRVVVEVEEFGIAETREMMIPRAGRGGS